MKTFLPCLLLIGCAGISRASIIESIDINLSNLHAGSMLTGTFTLPDAPAVGDTAPVVLTFSDPSDYSVPSLSATITIGFAITEDTVTFSSLVFTNPTGNSFTKNVDLIVAAGTAAQCASFPCTATGSFADGSPAAFTGTYSISPAAVPEPATGAMLLVSLVGLVIRKRR